MKFKNKKIAVFVIFASLLWFISGPLLNDEFNLYAKIFIFLFMAFLVILFIKDKNLSNKNSTETFKHNKKIKTFKLYKNDSKSSIIHTGSIGDIIKYASSLITKEKEKGTNNFKIFIIVAREVLKPLFVFVSIILIMILVLIISFFVTSYIMGEL